MRLVQTRALASGVPCRARRSHDEEHGRADSGDRTADGAAQGEEAADSRPGERQGEEAQEVLEVQRIARTRRQLIADVEGSEPETAGILLAHIDELGQALNQHYRPAQSRFSGDSDQ